MRTFDLTPLYRSTVGFDRLFNLIDTATKLDEAGGYPPYNIERLEEDAYRITLAVAGFSADDLDIEVHEQKLTVNGRRKEDESEREFLHRGIAGRSFERTFQLAEHVLIDGAALRDGLLSIDLRREIPEAKKPRKIAIGDSGAAGSVKTIDAKAA